MNIQSVFFPLSFSLSVSFSQSVSLSSVPLNIPFVVWIVIVCVGQSNHGSHWAFLGTKWDSPLPVPLGEFLFSHTPAIFPEPWTDTAPTDPIGHEWLPSITRGYDFPSALQVRAYLGEYPGNASTPLILPRDSDCKNSSIDYSFEETKADDSRSKPKLRLNDASQLYDQCFLKADHLSITFSTPVQSPCTIGVTTPPPSW